MSTPENLQSAPQNPPRRRKKRPNNNLPLLLLLLFVLLCASGPYLIWRFQPTRAIPTLIVDKTVPNHTYREHDALIWSLNHYKVESADNNTFWDKTNNYVGFYPAPYPGFSVENPGKGELLQTSDVQGKQLVFVTDTYGIYSQDIRDAVDYEKRLEAKESMVPVQDVSNVAPLESPDYSEKIYGGMQAEEVSVLENHVQKGGHLIGEFNLFASPTRGAERARLENLFGVKWSGWTGRFFLELENKEEVPAWARRNYEAQYGKPWTFTGKGWAFVHEDSRILVLEEDRRVDGKMQKQDLPAQALRIELEDHDLLKNVYDRVPYTYWFDVVEPTENTRVLAHYQFKLRESGKKKLKASGLPERFPFLLMASEQPLRLYLAGDASDRDHDAGIYQLAGRMQWERVGRFKEKKRSQEAFFWEFYLPWMDNVLRHVATTPCAQC